MVVHTVHKVTGWQGLVLTRVSGDGNNWENGENICMADSSCTHSGSSAEFCYLSVELFMPLRHTAYGQIVQDASQLKQAQP